MVETLPPQKKTQYEDSILLICMMRKRKMNGLQLAKASGLHKCSISRIITGRACPKHSTVLFICEALRCEPEDIGL